MKLIERIVLLKPTYTLGILFYDFYVENQDGNLIEKQDVYEAKFYGSVGIGNTLEEALTNLYVQLQPRGTY